MRSATAIALACILGLASGARAADFVMKFGTATVNESQHQYLKFYKQALEEASHGRIEVQVYPASQLGAIPSEIQGVQMGSIQAFMGPVDFFTGIEPRYGVFSAPLLFRDDAAVAATVQDSALEDKVLALAEAKGLVGMAMMNQGASDYGGRRPLLTLDDFKGKKLRINGTELERAKMAKLGATGVGLALSEVMPALDQGVIDGTISGLSIFVAFKMNSLVKVVTVTNDTFLVSIAMVSKRWLDGLPPDLAKLVLQTGRDLQTKAQAYEVEFSKSQEKEWASMGGEVHTLSADDMARMRTLLAPVGDDVTKDQPAVHEMLETVRAVAAKH